MEHLLILQDPLVLFPIQYKLLGLRGPELYVFFLLHPLSLVQHSDSVLSRDFITAANLVGFQLSGVGGVVEAKLKFF